MARTGKEVVVEDGFKYKRRKNKDTKAAGAGPGSNFAALGRRSTGGDEEILSEVERLRSLDPATVFAPDDPAWTLHENIPEDLPESERLQMLIEEICELEMKRERERLVEELGPEAGAEAAKSLEDALSEFQLKVEEMIVRGEIKFANDGDAGADLKDAKHEAMATVLSQLEDEKAQWDALEQEALAGASADDEASMEQMRKDVEEVNKAVEALIAAELAAENGEGGTAEELAKAVEEAERKLAMQQEGLSALVEGVEALCTRAERAAEVFSKAIAENDFKGLPHVNSPQNLVKNLVRGKTKK